MNSDEHVEEPGSDEYGPAAELADLEQLHPALLKRLADQDPEALAPLAQAVVDDAVQITEPPPEP